MSSGYLTPDKWMEKAEVLTVLRYLQPRARRSLSVQTNLCIFRLSCCCGLRVGEIAGLELRDFVWSGKPHIVIRSEITKGKNGVYRGRVVPVWWDSGTVADLKNYWDLRAMMVKRKMTMRFICTPIAGCAWNVLSTGQIAKRWKTAIKCLGPDRVKELSIHKGRHTFASLSLIAGHSLVEVKEALGHRTLEATQVYLHAVDASKTRPDVFAEDIPPEAAPEQCNTLTS